jgi:hypothetical protein
VELYLHSPNAPSWRGAQLGGAQGQEGTNYMYALLSQLFLKLERFSVPQLINVTQKCEDGMTHRSFHKPISASICAPFHTPAYTTIGPFILS